MADGSNRLHRASDRRDAAARRRSTQPYHPPAKVHLAMYATTVAMLMAATIMIIGGDRAWTWTFPAAAMAGAVYGYLRVRSAKTLRQGSVWILVQVVCSLGAFALLAIPAKY
jgi:hypothetical protein